MAGPFPFFSRRAPPNFCFRLKASPAFKATNSLKSPAGEQASNNCVIGGAQAAAHVSFCPCPHALDGRRRLHLRWPLQGRLTHFVPWQVFHSGLFKRTEKPCTRAARHQRCRA